MDVPSRDRGERIGVEMRKGTTLALMVAAAATLGILGVRACGRDDAKPAKARAIAADSAAPEATAKPLASVAPPRVAASSRAASLKARDEAGQGGVVFFSPWGGSTKDQLGRERPEEGNPMAPMSLTVDGKGRVFVLDEVNGRIVRYGADGKPEGESRIDLRAAQDLAVGKDGSLAVLDRVGDKAIALYDEGGALRGQLPLEGEGIDETGVVSGVFVDGDDVYVEREHGPLVKVGDVNGNPADPRTEIPGRPTRDGLSYINAGITDAETGRAYVASIERATGEHRFTRELRLKAPIRSIQLLDTDVSGTIYFAAEVDAENGPGSILLSCLDPLQGVPVGAAVLPVNTMPEETFRDLTVLDEGGVIYALRSEQGVTYQRYDCL
jgi:hypothetical protein